MSTFPPGALVYVDGEDLAHVAQAFPKGSTSHLFPHYKVHFVDGDRNVAVAMNRVGTEQKRPANMPDDPGWGDYNGMGDERG